MAVPSQTSADCIYGLTCSNEQNEHIFYNIYQTGIDNYRFEFLAGSGNDAAKLFEYYLTDAVYAAMNFNVSKNGNMLKMKTNLPTESITAITKDKTTVVLTNE